LWIRISFCFSVFPGEWILKQVHTLPPQGRLFPPYILSCDTSITLKVVVVVGGGGEKENSS
jgi:hypothetical protein